MPVSRIPSTRLVSVAVLVLLGGPPARPAAEAQSELVIYKEGTSQYHRAGCELVKDGKDVLALTRAQAEARGYRPHPECDPALRKPDAPPGAPAAPAAPPAKPQTVYVDGTKYYHRKDCRRLDANRNAVRAEPLDVAGKSSWPCPDCRPPVRPRNRASEPLGRVR